MFGRLSDSSTGLLAVSRFVIGVRASEKNFVGGTKTDTAPQACRALIET